LLQRDGGLVRDLAFNLKSESTVAEKQMTAPAIVWAAHLGWINLSGSHLAFIGSAWAVGIFTLGALVEFIADQRPTTPARTTAVPLAARIVIGSPACASLEVRRFGWGSGRGGRRNRWSIRRLSGSPQTGSSPSRSGHCNCGLRSDRNRIGIVSGFQILRGGNLYLMPETPGRMSWRTFRLERDL
jgi:hypothetical protein